MPPKSTAASSKTRRSSKPTSQASKTCFSNTRLTTSSNSQSEIAAIHDKATLYKLRAALARYKDLRNVARQLGYEDLYDRFDVERAQEMLREVRLHIDAINSKEALALKDMSTGAVNTLLSKIEFNFRRIGEDELAIADEFQDKLRSTYGAFADNFDNDDPEYVNLLEELRKRFEKMDIEEMTSADMATSIKELDRLRSEIEEINRENNSLAKKYGGDEKFARAHKRALRTPPPLTESKTALFSVLSSVKANADSTVMSNHNILDNEGFLKKSMARLMAQACKANGIAYTVEQVASIAGYLAKEYINRERTCCVVTEKSHLPGTDILADTKAMIDGLRSVCASAGLANDSSEYKIITEAFLYKFLNDKFLHELRKLDAFADASNLEQAYADVDEAERELLLLELADGTAYLRPEYLISHLFNRKDTQGFADTFDNALKGIADDNLDVFSVQTGQGQPIRLFNGVSRFIVEEGKRGQLLRAARDKTCSVLIRARLRAEIRLFCSGV